MVFSGRTILVCPGDPSIVGCSILTSRIKPTDQLMTHILSKSTSDATAALQTVVTSNLKLSHRNALFGVFSVFVLALGAQTIRELIKIGSDWSNSHASQILVVPFITAWLLWLRRKTVFQNSRVSIRPGTAVMALGSLLLVFGKTGAAQLNAND